MNYAQKIQELLREAVKRDASDLHITVDRRPTLRIYGKLVELEHEDVLTAESAEGLISELLPPAGLVTGDTCVRLSISDGGPNDGDLLANGSIRVTGGVAITRAAAAAAAAPDATKGGAIEMLFLSLLALAGFRTRRHGK